MISSQRAHIRRVAGPRSPRPQMDERAGLRIPSFNLSGIALLGSMYGFAVVAPSYAAYYGEFGLALTDVNVSSTEIARLTLPILGIVGVSLAAGAVLWAPLNQLADNTVNLLSRRHAWSAGRIAYLLSLGTFSAWLAFAFWTPRSLLIQGLQLSILVGFALPAFRLPIEHAELNSLTAYIVSATSIIFTTALLVDYPVTQWKQAASAAHDIRLGRPNYPESLLTHVLAEPALVQPLTGDPLGLCPPAATATLVGRGSGVSYLVYRTRSLSQGVEAPVLTLAAADYNVFSVADVASRGSETICQTPWGHELSEAGSQPKAAGRFK